MDRLKYAAVRNLTTDTNCTNRSVLNVSNITKLTLEDEKCHVAVLVTFSAIIIIVNGFIVTLFITTKKLRKRPANIMICSQACADLYTGIVFIPLCLVKNKDSEAILPFLSGYMLYVALFNLLALSFDRYLAIIKPLLHYKLMDKRYIRKIVVLVWTVPLGLILVPLFWWFENSKLKTQLQRIYVCAQWSLMFIIVLLVSTLYFFITKQARKSIRGRMADLRFQTILIANNSPRLSRRREQHRILGMKSVEMEEERILGKRFGQLELLCKEKVEIKETNLSKKELRVVHLFGLLLFFLVAAYSPILYMNIFIVMLQKPSYVSEKVICISLYSLILNSVVTPVLCILLKKDYLDAIKDLKCTSKK